MVLFIYTLVSSLNQRIGGDLNAPALSTLRSEVSNEFPTSRTEHENLLAAVFVLVLGNTSSGLSVERNVRDEAY